MVKIKKAKDINGESFYFASHAQATFLDDGSTVQDQIEQIKEITNNYVSPDLSNCVTPQQLSNSLSSKQDVILDLDAIREGAIKGKAALQRKDLASIAFSNNYSDLGNVPHIPTIEDVEEWGFVNQDTVTELLNTKVDAVDGKVLSSNDFTDILKSKLENLTNYDDSEIQLAVETLQESFDTLVNGDTTTAIKSFNEIISFLDGIQDSQDLSSIIANIQQQITGKADKSSLSTVATSGSYNDLTNKPTIPSAVTESTVSGWGFTKKTGTITGVSVNNKSVATSGVANIPAASTGVYGVTKLNSATNSTSTTLAATPSAVKSAYDLANSKQEKLTSGTNIKTVNGESILGSGNIEIIESAISLEDTSETIDDISGTNYVKYVTQTLTDAQKTQARANIGAAAIEDVTLTESDIAAMGFTKNTGTYSKPSSGIPKSDLASAVQTSLGKADTALQSYTEQYKGTITGVSANGKSVATSGVANIPAASTSAYGVTKLNSSTSSTSTTEAATPSAVKAAYDLANSYKGTVTSVKINGSTKRPTDGIVDLGTVITTHQVLKTINGESIVGSGNITISGGDSSSGGSVAYSEVNHGTSDTTFTLTPNTFHIWDEVASLTLNLGSETSGVANEFLFQFNSGATATSLTLPDDIKWTGGEAPSIEANKIYQISILKGLGSVLEWNNAPTLIENKATLTFDTITFQYPVASELVIKVVMNTVTISAGEKSCQIQCPEPGMEIMSISPISDSTYYYTF